jgi:hypothetical protein
MAAIVLADRLFVPREEGANIGLGLAATVLYPACLIACWAGIVRAQRRNSLSLAVTVAAAALAVALLVASLLVAASG